MVLRASASSMLQADGEKTRSRKHLGSRDSRAARGRFRRRKPRARKGSALLVERRARNSRFEISGRFFIRRDRRASENPARHRDESSFLRAQTITGEINGKISLKFMKDMNCEEVLIQKLALIDGEKSELSEA